MAAPRGHAKSTVVSLFYVLWSALTGRNQFILLVSKTQALAAQLLRSIRIELETNQGLIGEYANQVTGRWNETEIVMANGCMIAAAGAGKQLRGIRNMQHRPDLVIVDDLEGEEYVRRRDNREKLKHWFQSTLSNTMHPSKGRMVVVGTVLHPYSLLSELVNPNLFPAFVKMRFQAIENDQAIFPDRFSKQKLDEIKAEIGSYAFACEYQNQPVDVESKMFQTSWLSYYDAVPSNLYVITAIDPAVSESESADYTAAITIGFDAKTNAIYVLDIYRKRGTVDNHARAIQAIYQRFNPSMIYVEDMAFQAVWRQVIYDAASRNGINLPLRGIKNLKDKQLRIQSLQSMFENGKILLRRDMREFIEDEYDIYPNSDHDDMLDALEVAVRNTSNRGGVA